MKVHRHLYSVPKTVVRIAYTCMLAAFLGCGPSGAQDKHVARIQPGPSAADLLEATHPAYVTPTGSKQECLGRLVFDAPRDMQWGINAPGKHSGDRYRFTENMHGGHDDLWVGDTRIVVAAPATRPDIERMFSAIKAEKNIAIRSLRESIETDRRLNEDRAARLKDPSLRATSEDLILIRQRVEETKQQIADAEANITGIEKAWQPMDIGIPDSLGYAAGPDFHAFIFRDGRAYKFLSASGDGQPSAEVRKSAFLALLKHFQFRKMYEVPKVPGICVPFGFAPDDGKPGFRLAVSFRYADRLA